MSISLLVASTTSSEFSVSVFNPHTRQLTHTFSLPDEVGCWTPVSPNVIAVALASKATLVYCQVDKTCGGVGGSAAVIYRTSTPERLTALACDGDFLYGGGLSGALFVWKMDTGELVKHVSTWHFGEVTFLSVVEAALGGCGGIIVVSASVDDTVKVWRNLADPVVVSLPEVKTVAVASAVGGSVAVAAGFRDGVKVFPKGVLYPVEDVTSVVWVGATTIAAVATETSEVPKAPVGSVLWSGTASGRVAIISPGTSTDVQYLDAHSSAVVDLFATVDGGEVFTAAADCVKVWDADARECLKVLTLDKPGLIKKILAVPGHAPGAAGSVGFYRPLERVLTELGAVEAVKARGVCGRSVDEVAAEVYGADVARFVADGRAIEGVVGVLDMAKELEEQREITRKWIEVVERK
jgi:WD40 repeat protein